MSGSTEQQTRMEGKWEQMRGRVKEAWGALTDDDLDRIDGRWDQLVGTVRERTGEATEVIERRVNAILDKLQEAGSRD